MKAIHRKTIWLHTIFSFVICGLLLVIVLVRQSVPSLMLAGIFAIYVLGNGYIHIKRDDMKRETMYEYLLLALAVFVVLASTI
jgi:hypothetical protein